MSDDATWRRLVSPQDALLWWLLPRVGAASRRAATSALRWAGENLHSPADLGAWIERTSSEPGINPIAVASYLSAIPLLIGAMRRPPTPESVQDALRGANLDATPPGLPEDAVRVLAAVMQREEGLGGGARGGPPGAAGGGGPPGGVPPWRGVRLTPDVRRAIQWAHASAAVNVSRWASTVRDDLRWQTMIALRAGRSYRQQARVLRDGYTQWGADFERVALTEAHASMMAGRLLGYPEGSTVRAILAPGACQDCRRLLEGKTFTVRREPGDSWTEVWPGKTNAGLPRSEWRPCVPEHPRCRCVLVIQGFGKHFTT